MSKKQSPEPLPKKNLNIESTPESLQQAFLQWLYKSRSRGWITLVIFVFLALHFLWSAIPVSIQETMLQRVPWFQTHPTLPQATKVNAGWFEIVGRTDYVDLDLFKKVPVHLADYNVSPTMRTVNVTLVKHHSEARYFYNHQFTSGPRQNVVCLSNLPFEVYEVLDEGKTGRQQLRKYELKIDVDKYPVGQQFDIRWQRVEWNKYQDFSHQWTSIEVKYKHQWIELIVDFPAERGIKQLDLEFVEREIGQAVFSTFTGTLVVESNVGDVFKWKIANPKINYEYAISWKRLFQ